MRLYEFTLMEYSRDITIQKLGNKLSNNHENKPIEEVIAVLEDIDPTKNKQYVLWLANQYIKKQFRLEDKLRINKLLLDFNKLKPRLAQKDIGKYDLYLLDKTIDDILNPNVGVSDEFDTDIPGVKILYKGPLGFLTIPETEDASCKLGSGTKWCTAAREDNKFAQYNDHGPLYIWKDNTGKYQFHFEAMQFMDSQDVPLTPEKLKYFRLENPVTKKLFLMKEKEIAKDPTLAYDYASDIIHARFEPGEEAISKDPNLSYKYARDVLKGRFELGEPAIAERQATAFNYANGVIKGRFPLGENAIATDTRNSYYYAHDVLKGRFELGEQAISTSGDYSYDYAVNILHDRFELGEKAIASTPSIAYDYAVNVLHDRFELGEQTISQDSRYSYDYAKNILNGRFELGEPTISQSEFAYDYAKNILKGRFKLGEKAIASDDMTSVLYAINVLKGRFKSGERTIKQDSDIRHMYNEFLKSIGEESI